MRVQIKECQSIDLSGVIILSNPGSSPGPSPGVGLGLRLLEVPSVPDDVDLVELEALERTLQLCSLQEELKLLEKDPVN